MKLSFRMLLKKIDFRVFLLLFGVTTFFMVPYFFVSFDGNIIGVQGDAWQVYDDVLYMDKEFGVSFIDRVIGFLQYMANPYHFFNERNWRYPLHLLFGSVHSYNLFWIFSFYFSTFTGYLLSKEVIKDKKVAVIGALLLSFVPAHFAYGLGFGTAVHVGVIYLFVFAILRFQSKMQFSYFLLLAIAFAFLVRSEPHFAFFASIFSVFYFVYLLLFNRSFFIKKKLRGYYALGFLSLVGGLWYAIDHYMYWNERFSLQIGQDEIAYRSINLIGLGTPYSFHPIWGDFFHAKIFSDFFGGVISEQTAYVGIVSIFFCVVFIILLGLKKIQLNRKMIFFSLLALVFLIIGMGPLLQIKGIYEPNIILPYQYLFERIDFFASIRAIGRSFIYFQLFLVLFLLFTMREFFALISKKISFNVFAVIISVIVLDFYAVNPSVDVHVPDFFTTLQAPKEEGESIVMIPAASSYLAASKARIYIPYHDYQVIGNRDFARQSLTAFEFEKGTPILNDVLYVQPLEQIRPNLFYYNPDRIANSVLQHRHVRYIFIDKQFVVPDETQKPEKISQMRFEQLRGFIESHLPVEKYLETDDSFVYEVQDNGVFYPFLSYGYQWMKRDEIKPEMYFEGSDSTFSLIVPKDTTTLLTFFAKTFAGSGKVNFEINGARYEYDLSEKQEGYVVDLGELAAGEYEINLHLDGVNGKDVQFSWFRVRAGEEYQKDFNIDKNERYILAF